MKRWLIAVLPFLFAGVAVAGDDGPPEPCFETVGCVSDREISAREAEKLGCDQLWTVRNGLYAARGYCFKTARGREAFGNASCQYDDQSQVPLNDYERANIRLIRAIEKRRGC
jgi:YARHG domain